MNCEKLSLMEMICDELLENGVAADNIIYII